MAAVNTSAPGRPYGGTSAEDRLAERRERLLEAGLELLGGEGAASASVRGVCRQANLGPRYFYESFPDLDSLLLAIFDRILAEAGVRVLTAVEAAPADAHAKSRAAIATFVEYVTDDPRRARVLFVEAFGNERLMLRRLDGLRAFSELVMAQAQEFYDPPPGSEQLAEVAAKLLVGGMTEVLMSWLDGALDMTRDQVIDDLTELFTATGESALTIAKKRAAR
jgi:AcrR family transcriptional regulator